MAVHSFDKDTQREYESAAAFRAQLDREAERHAQEMYRREEERNEANYNREEQLRIEREEQRRREQSANKTIGGDIMRSMRSTLKDDPYGREAYNTFIEFSALRNAGMVMGSLLANTAAEASYVASLEEARDSEIARKTNDTSIVDTAQQQVERTLQDYIKSVEDTRAAYTGTATTYHVEFEETRKEAERVQATANRAYETIKSSADEAIRAADDTYTRSLASITRDAEIALTRRDEVIQTASRTYDTEIKQIVSTHSSGGEATKLIDTATQKQQTAIETAHKDYEAAVQTIRDTHDAATAERMIESASQTRDLAIAAASKQYVAEVRQIAETHMDADAVKLIDTATQRRETAVVAATRDYDTAHERLETQRTAADEAHRVEITRQTDRIATAERNRDTVIDRQNAVIQTSQIKRDEAISAARQEMTNAQNKLATFEENKAAIPTAAAALQRQLNPIEGTRTNVTLENYAQGVEKVQTRIGTEMALRMGTDDEKRFVSAILEKQDKGEASPQELAKLRSISMQYSGNIAAGGITGAYSIDAQTAAKLGTESERKFINSILDKGEAATSAEMKQVEAIMKKYEGEMAFDFGTTGCRDAVASIENFRQFLEKENATIASEIQLKTSELSGIESKIAINQAAIQKLESIQTQLATGKGIDGKALTEGQIKELKQMLPKASKEAAEAASIVTGLTQQKNAIKATLGQLSAKQAKNGELIKGIGAQTDRLKKNGKAIALQLIASKGKEVKNGVDKSNKKFNKSIDKIAKEQNRKINKGDILWEEMNRVTVKAMMNERKFHRAVAIASYARHITSPIAQGFGKGVRQVGKITGTTALKEKALHSNAKIGGWVDKSRAKQLEKQQKKIEEAKKLKAENEKRKAAGLKPLKSKEEQRIDKIGKIIGAPMHLRNAPKEFIRTKTTQLAKKATSKAGAALGKTRLGKWANKTFSPALQAMKKFQQKLQKFNPANLINKVKEKIIGWLLSILSSVLSFVAEIVGYAAAVIGIILLIIIVVLLILMLIFAAIAAILNFFQKMGSAHQSLVKNDPSFMLEQAVNYRDSELQMLEMFKSNDPAVWESWGLIPCNDPFYLAMSYKLGDTVIESPAGTLEIMEPYNANFKNWYFDTRMGSAITTGDHTRWKTNSDGTYAITVVGPTGTKWTYNINKSTMDTQDLIDIYNWHTTYRRYDRIQLNYYTSAALGGGEAYGEYTLKNNAVPVGYEISNAKDALAVTDAVYINKKDTMQRFEVLAYLGVGKYQMAQTDGNKPLMNLFWATHKPIYLSGTSASDVWYHKTKSDTGAVDPNALWNGSSAPYQCDSNHQLTITQKYETDKMVAPHSTPDMYCRNDGWAASKTSKWTYRTASTVDGKKDLYYRYLFMTGSKLPGYTLSEKQVCDSKTLRDGYYYGNLKSTIYLEHAYTSWGVRYYRVYDSTRTHILDTFTFASWPAINNRDHMRLTWDGTEGNYVYYDITNVPSNKVTTPSYYEYTLDSYSTSCNCAKVADGVTDYTATTTVCLGHLDLKMAMIVSSIGGDADAEDLKVQESFLYDAARVTPVPEGQTKGNFLFTWDTDTGIFGFGDVDVEPFDPSVDLAEDGDIRNLAKGKAQLKDEKYELENEDDDPSANSETQYHLNASFTRLRKSPENTLLYGMHFGGRTFYVESYTSGLQKELPYYEWLSGAAYKSGTLLSIKMNTAEGKPYIP